MFDGEKTMNLGIASYVLIDPKVNDKDPDYDMFTDTIYIHDNTFKGAPMNPTGMLGAFIALGLGELTPPTTTTPDVIWDGVVGPTKADAQDPTKFQPDLNICIKSNGDADFANLAYPPQDATKPTTDMTVHDCTHPALPAVTFTGA